MSTVDNIPLTLLMVENGVMLAAIGLTTYGMPLVVGPGNFFRPARSGDDPGYPRLSHPGNICLYGHD